MKRRIFLMVVTALAALLQIKAQTPVKLEEAPDPVLKYFSRQVPAAMNVTWTQVEDDRDVYVLADYTLDGDQKQMVFRNNAYSSTKTQVPLQYCPKAIKTVLDSVAPGFKMTELYLQMGNKDKGYCAVMQKGKGKKLQTRDFLFTVKGEFVKESDVQKVVRGF